MVVCAGKVYYDLLEAATEKKLEDVAIIRLEQLYPFPADALVKRISRMANLETVVWAQEEPKNAGAWFFVEPLVEDVLAEAGVTPLVAAYRASIRRCAAWRLSFILLPRATAGALSIAANARMMCWTT